MKSLETNRSINTALVYAALGAGALLMIFPFIWMVFTSFKSAGESVQIPPTILPKQWKEQERQEIPQRRRIRQCPVGWPQRYSPVYRPGV